MTRDTARLAARTIPATPNLRTRETDSTDPPPSSEIRVRAPRPGALPRRAPVVLIADDDHAIHLLLDHHLTLAGLTPCSVLGADTRTIVELAEAREASVVVLERVQPDGDGLELCRALRASRAGPAMAILFLSALGGEADRFAGLAAGADDYVAKPFSLRELLLRINVLETVAENRRAARLVGRTRDARLFRWRDLIVDVNAHRVSAGGVDRALRPFEFALLVSLLEAPGRTWTREDLMHRLWGERQTEITPRTIDVHVRRLRDRLGAHGEAIETVHGTGYRLRRA